MGPQTLEDWLAYQETLHPKTIDLGLQRVRAVLDRLALPKTRALTISIAGTNGKGSCVAVLDRILRASGRRVGAYTSPHIQRYNERIAVDGVPVDDADLLRAFQRIEAARGDLSLSFFEFGTLAALVLFAERPLDVQLLEVGLGGRLDAVNVVDADLALIASIDIDHQEWLGNTREAIGLEKAGIMRSGRPVVLGDPEVPSTVIDHAEAIGARAYLSGRDFGFERAGADWTFWGSELSLGQLPPPAIPGDHQYLNAAAVLQCLALLPPSLRPSAEAVIEGLTQVRLAGRFQYIEGTVPVLLDVAHNPQAVGALARFLAHRFQGVPCRAVFAVMRDKDIAEIVQRIKPQIAAWYLAPLGMTRAASPVELAEILHNGGAGPVYSGFTTVRDAVKAAQADAEPGELLLVFGSFFLVSDYLTMTQEGGLHG
jgi:dihydrofolate synthase/folylpolyglutamate synthase